MIRIFILENSQAALVQMDALSLSPSPWDTLEIQNHSRCLRLPAFRQVSAIWEMMHLKQSSDYLQHTKHIKAQKCQQGFRDGGRGKIWHKRAHFFPLGPFVDTYGDTSERPCSCTKVFGQERQPRLSAAPSEVADRYTSSFTVHLRLHK